MNERLSESIKHLYSFLTVSIGFAFIVQTFGKLFLLILAIKYSILHVAHCLLTVLHLSFHSLLALSLLCFLKQLFSLFHVSHTDIHKHFHVQVKNLRTKTKQAFIFLRRLWFTYCDDLQLYLFSRKWHNLGCMGHMLFTHYSVARQHG